MGLGKKFFLMGLYSKWFYGGHFQIETHYDHVWFLLLEKLSQNFRIIVSYIVFAKLSQAPAPAQLAGFS